MMSEEYHFRANWFVCSRIGQWCEGTPCLHRFQSLLRSDGPQVRQLAPNVLRQIGWKCVEQLASCLRIESPEDDRSLA